MNSLKRSLIEPIALLFWVLILYLFMFDMWQGDPSIYLVYAKNLLHGHGLVFNLGEPSASFASPLWLGLITLSGATPTGDKIVSLVVFMVGIFFIYKAKGINMAAIAAYVTFVFACYCYETPLVVLAVSLFLCDWRKSSYLLLSLARPEGFIYAIFFMIWKKEKLKSYLTIIPAILYHVAIFLYVGIPASHEQRIAFHFWNLRYFVPLLPFALMIAEEVIKQEGRLKYLIFVICVCLSFLKLSTWERYNFDTMTYRDVADVINNSGDKSLLTSEVQIKYWLRDDVRVISNDQLINHEVSQYKDLQECVDREKIRWYLKGWNEESLPGSLYMIPKFSYYNVQLIRLNP